MNWTAEYFANSGSGTAGFVFDSYDTTKPLVFLVGPPPMMGGPSVFTPGICWSTYYGGDERDEIYGSRIDFAGNYLVAGSSWSQEATFPIEAGQVLVDASPAVVVARFDNADNLKWSTYYGCTNGDQRAYACAVPSLGGEIYFCGQTAGTDLVAPLEQPAERYVNMAPSANGNGFLGSLNENGTLKWSTYFGGIGSAVYNMDFDALGNLYLCGRSSGDLPVPTEVAPPIGSQFWSNSGGTDAFAAKMTQTMKVGWSTYIGGSGTDQAFSIRLGAGKFVVVGKTSSPTFQTMTAGGAGAHNFATSTYPSDIFLEEFSLGCLQQWGSFFNYGGTIEFQGLAVDKNNGDILLGGQMFAGTSTMPVSTEAPWYQLANSAIFEKSFIYQLGADHVCKYSTYVTGFGGTCWLNSIEVGPTGQIYAAGISWAPTMSTECQPALYCSTERQGYGDAFILSLTPDHWRSWLTYFGGNEDDNNVAERIRTIALKPISAFTSRVTRTQAMIQ